MLRRTKVFLLTPLKVILLLLMSCVMFILNSCTPNQATTFEQIQITPGVSTNPATVLQHPPASPMESTPSSGTEHDDRCNELGVRQYQNDVMGLEFAFPPSYMILEDKYLSDEYGFVLSDSTRNPVLRVSWLYKRRPHEQEQIIDEIIPQLNGTPIQQTMIEIDGKQGVMFAPIPGEIANTVIFLSVDERLYTLRYFAGEPDDLAWCLFNRISFYQPTRSLEEIQLTPSDEALRVDPATETAILATETAASVGATTPEETIENPLPPTPISLSDVSSEWVLHQFPKLGISLSMPADWTMSPRDEGFFFAPANSPSPTQLTVGAKVNVPTDLQSMIETLRQEWANLTPTNFHTTPITIDGIEGIAFWNISPQVCADIYIPSDDLVRQVSLYSTFCNQAGDALNDVGLKVLDSITIYRPLR